MGLSQENQSKLWIFIQKTLYESPELDKLLSNMQILSNIYKHNVESGDDDNELTEKIETIVIRIKDFRLHKVVRKQIVIQELKSDIDDLCSEMCKSVDAKTMLEFNIYEAGNM